MNELALIAMEELAECPHCGKTMAISQDKNWLECCCGNVISLRSKMAETEE